VRLDRVEIRNFRSIANITVTLEPACRILVGITESGKSNILRALSLLNPDITPTAADVRDFPPDEDADQEAYVRFVFVLDKKDRATITAEAMKRVLIAKPSALAIHLGGKSMTVKQFFDSRNEVLLRVNLRTGVKHIGRWGLDADAAALPGWQKPSAACPNTYAVQLSDGISAPLSNFKLVQEEAVSEAPPEYLEEITAEDLSLLIHSEAIVYVGSNLPTCLYWSYSENNLLPPQVNLEDFAANPSSCAPLKHMFELAGVPDIPQVIAAAQSKPNGIRNLLNRVGKRATKHMHAVWKEYAGIEIELALNGTNIDATVKDEYNVYDFSRRSDSFKRFVTFLLMISARERTEDLTNTLYLHDEPDVSLHPSGARHLRDELIKISRANYVVFSTHSIFMIDRDLLRRHLIVEKRGDVTRIKEVNESNITDEEVIYNALAYSIFENLKEFNIVFKGWRDKRLFKTALTNLPTKSKQLKKQLLNMGTCHARGVKDIGRITPMLELAARRWMVISDGDKAAVEYQRLYDGDGSWLRYDQLLGVEGTALTGEDFLRADAFKQILKDLSTEYPALGPLPYEELARGDPKLGVIRSWLTRGGITSDAVKPMIERVKERLFTNLKPSHIDERYHLVLEAIAKSVRPG
jgi:hypothetical protein